MHDGTSTLLTDLYQLNMIQAYLDHGETKTGVFEFFVRKFPARRGFLVAAGLEQALDFLEGLRFSTEEIDWLARSGRFDKELLDYLAEFHFTGDDGHHSNQHQRYHGQMVHGARCHREAEPIYEEPPGGARG
jgi:nicotinate phosphoribosyltransferase